MSGNKYNFLQWIILTCEIDLNQIKIAYDNFRNIHFPETPIEDELYGIYSDLVEFDAYTAGLISSFLKGKKIRKSDLQIDKI